MQRCSNPQSPAIVSVDAMAHAFPPGPVLVAYLRAAVGNAGTVTIAAVPNTGIAAPNNGIVLAAGEWHPPIGPLLNFESLQYTFSNGSSDVLEVLVLS